MPKEHQLTLMTEIKVHSSVEAEGRKAGMSRRKGWFRRIKVGTFPQRGHPGRFALVEMVMKRVGFGDWYSKRVIDAETGEIIATREHRFSEHQGYGSAKIKRPDAASEQP